MRAGYRLRCTLCLMVWNGRGATRACDSGLGTHSGLRKQVLTDPALLYDGLLKRRMPGWPCRRHWRARRIRLPAKSWVGTCFRHPAQVAITVVGPCVGIICWINYPAKSGSSHGASATAGKTGHLSLYLAPFAATHLLARGADIRTVQEGNWAILMFEPHKYTMCCKRRQWGT